MSVDKVLYEKVKIAREACAGSDRGHYDLFSVYLQEALLEAFETSEDIYAKLLDVKRQFKTVKTFYGRLPLDKILCDILNNDLKGSG